MNIVETVETIMRDVFDLPELQVTPALTAQDVEEWDSISHISLVVALEKEFSIRFALGELQSLQNVGEMLALIEKKCKP